MPIAVGVKTDYAEPDRTVTSHSFSHDGGSGSDRLLVLLVLHRESRTILTGPTYNGVAMTEAVVGPRLDQRLRIFTLVNPATGVNTVSFGMSFYTGVSAKAISLTGVDQTTPVSNTDTLAIEASDPHDVSVTAAAGELVIAAIGNSTSTDPSFVVTAGTAIGSSLANPEANLHAGYLAGAGGAATVTFTESLSTLYGVGAAVAIAEAAPSTSPPDAPATALADSGVSGSDTYIDVYPSDAYSDLDGHPYDYTHIQYSLDSGFTWTSLASPTTRPTSGSPYRILNSDVSADPGDSIYVRMADADDTDGLGVYGTVLETFFPVEAPGSGGGGGVGVLYAKRDGQSISIKIAIN